MGTCRFWHPERSFGFLRVTGHADIFVPSRAVRPAREELTVGQRVRFLVRRGGDSRLFAWEVEVIE
ncbi:MAG: hypothetical protein R2745_03710 [Vicinamibacterales bacterium]